MIIYSNNKCITQAGNTRQHFILLRIYYDTQGSTDWINNTGWKAYTETLVSSDNYVSYSMNSINPLTGTLPYYLWEEYFQAIDKNKTLNDIISSKLKSKNIDICNLYGITCSDTLDLVKIDLSNNNLTGQITSQLSFLDTLEYLNFSNNRLDGPLPTGLFSLESLKYLDLSHNQITCDPFPPVNSPNLISINLSYNKLKGYFSLSWKSPMLEYLNLSFNQLSGTIPNPLFKQGKLRKVDLSNNKLIGFVPLLSKGIISHLNISHNQLIGSLYINSLWKTGYLEVLDIQDNEFTGYLPQTILDYAPFKYINLLGNELLGTIPSSIVCDARITILTNLAPSHCTPFITKVSTIDPLGGNVTISGVDFGMRDPIVVKFSDGTICEKPIVTRPNSVIRCKNPPGRHGKDIYVTVFNQTTKLDLDYHVPVVESISRVPIGVGGKVTISGKHLTSFEYAKVQIEDFIANDTVVSDTSLIFTIPPNANISIPATLNVVIDGLQANVSDISFYYTSVYNPDIRVSSPQSYTDHIYVYCTTLPMKDLAEIRINSKPCLNMRIINESSAVCVPPQNSYGSNNKVGLVFPNMAPQYTKTLSYPAPIIDHIPGLSMTSGGILTIYGRNLKAKRNQISVTIGNITCCPLNDEPDDYILCYYPAVDKENIIYNQPAEISVQNQTVVLKHAYTNTDSVCEDQCIQHSTARCRGGRCECLPNFTGPLCERDIPDTTIEPYPDAPGFKYHYPEYISDYVFTVQLHRIELIENDEILDTSGLQWTMEKTNTTDTIYTAKHNDILINVRLFRPPKHIIMFYGGEEVEVPRNNGRFIVDLKNENNLSSANYSLNMHFWASTIQDPNYICPPAADVRISSLNSWVTIGISDIVLYHRITQRIDLDGLVFPMNSKIISSNSNDRNTKILYSSSQFQKHLNFQCDFSTLMAKNEVLSKKDGGCYTDTNRSFPDRGTIVFVIILSIIFFMTIVIAYCSHLESRKRKKYIKAFEKKEEHIPFLATPSLFNQPYFNILEDKIEPIDLYPLHRSKSISLNQDSDYNSDYIYENNSNNNDNNNYNNSNRNPMHDGAGDLSEFGTTLSNSYSSNISHNHQ
ncbi:hypothetical protein CYY_003191 [Polysphondylium violaceum]|uniref:EGF-like domain-containing protein n=1 Tax=Polysphondylium violaceum TaxID=133409 RepID=A0A8J4PYW0_9MYCE|nr:hypothetical protein CYY_003191 [Polysphondylium violaceum]